MLMNDLLECYKKQDKIPSLSFYKQHGQFHPCTYIRRFGSWNKSLLLCFNEINREKPPLLPVRKCLFCGKETKNPKFCSSSCAGSYNNKKYPKRKKYVKKCSKCGKKTNRSTNKCKQCYVEDKINFFGEKMISEFYATAARHKYQKIRNHAHRVAKFHNVPKKCKKCEYNIHVDLCHIKPIGSFGKNTKIKIVNSLNNLVYLCKNHHWELDHNVIDKDQLTAQ